MKNSILTAIIIFMFLVLNKPLFSQEAGVSFGTSVFPAGIFEQAYYPYIDFVNSPPVYGAAVITAKEFMIHYSYYLHTNVKLDISAGYGFSNTKDDRKIISPGLNEVPSVIMMNSEELNTEGYPGGLELQFFAPINESGTLIPFIGIGAGYCSYKTSVTEKNNNAATKTDFRTKGFGQYVSAGLNIKFMDRASVFFQLNKLLLSSLKTEKSNPERFPSSPNDPVETSSIEPLIQPGFGDVALSAGVRLYLGK